MPSLILSGDTVSVNLTSERLEVSRRDNGDMFNHIIKKISVPLYDIDRVIIEGRPNISLPTIQRLMSRGIPAFFITSRHQWLGALLPDNNMNAERRIRQYELARNQTFNLQIAKKIVFCKLKNSRRVLQRLSANREQSNYSFQKKTSEQLQHIIEKVEDCNNIDELRGHEGMGAALYFARLASFFPDTTPFVERSRRPPKNAANALLSWTYAIVQGEIDCAIRKHGLDPCIGFLHSISHGTPSLTVDLLETLRAPLCDMLTLHLFNHKILSDESFEFNSEDGGTYLIQDAKKDFFFSYENSMIRKFTLKKGENHTDFRRIIESQVCNIIKAMEGSNNFDFFVMP